MKNSMIITVLMMIMDVIWILHLWDVCTQHKA